MILEVCVGSLEDVRIATLHGADRLELCGALELGGLTPSLGLIEQVVGETDLPVMVMIRARAGGFCYSHDEFQTMLRDAELALSAGASGVVFGALREDGTVDCERVAQLTKLSGKRDSVFHRAFDFVPNQSAALEELIDLEVTRVLTTGGAQSAVAGIDALCQLNSQAAERIEIMPGGGVDAVNVARILSKTGCTMVHAGCSRSDSDPSLQPADAASLCDRQRLAEGTQRAVDGDQVSALKAILRTR